MTPMYISIELIVVWVKLSYLSVAHGGSNKEILSIKPTFSHNYFCFKISCRVDLCVCFFNTSQLNSEVPLLS